MYFGMDPLYWAMMIPVLILSFFTSFLVKSRFKKYSKIMSRSGKTGAQVAMEILRRNNLGHIGVVETRGFLSDHYDPSKKIVRLSRKVFSSSSVSSIGVAAHETGHAIQHAKSYTPLVLRNLMAPVASIGSNLAWVIIIGGYILGFLGLAKIGVVLFQRGCSFSVNNTPC